MRGSSLRLASLRKTNHEDLREDLGTVTVIGTQSKTNAKPINANRNGTVPRKSWQVADAVSTTKDTKDTMVKTPVDPGSNRSTVGALTHALRVRSTAPAFSRSSQSVLPTVASRARTNQLHDDSAGVVHTLPLATTTSP